MMCEELKDHLIFISMHSDIDRPELLRRLSLQLLGVRFDIFVQQSPSEAKYVSHHLVAREKKVSDHLVENPLEIASVLASRAST